MELLGYLVDALTPFNLVLALAGVILGTVIGALPGLSATMAVAVLVPFTFTMAPASGLIALGAIYTGAIYGGAFAAILVNTPGTPSSIATTFDGYPMAKRGDGGLAVTLATLASVAGGLVGALALLFLAPPLARVALAFGPPEYFWLAIFGLTLIAALSVGNTLKGLIGACLGLLLSMVGVAVVGGDVRLTGDIPAFLGGIDVTSALIGLYCVPVILDLVATPEKHLQILQDNRGFRLREASRIAWRSRLNVLRSSVIGTVIGILPGAGGSIAGLVSYTEARRASPRSANFGKGEPDGVIATEAANNATVGGGFIPTLVLGIPGTPPDAIILGALLVQGIKIGPQLFTSEAGTVYTFIYGLLIATLLMLPAGLLIGRYAYRSVASFPKALLVPTVAFLTVIGSFAIHSNTFDTQMMFVLGVIAWGLNRLGFAPSPIVLGLVLGQIAEQGFVQTWLIGSATHNLAGMYFGRPISLGILCAALVTLCYPFWADRRARRRAAAAEMGAETAATPEAATEASHAPAARRGRPLGVIAIAVALVALGALALRATLGLSPMGAVFPRAISVMLIALSAVLLVVATTGRTSGYQPQPGESHPRRWGLAAVFGLWVFLIPTLGFAAASLAAFLAMMLIAEYERRAPATWALRVAIAVGVVAAFTWLMSDVLLLRLPASPFL
ncbi:tripartite tricarboxylate transporter permease [Frigidibacter sp. MR17.24]|uniref:tripartite tricarboxylate transporter permease n=1 Tax=Frigidibacter sp. MR17.24 TaxID=3127345 RepID=UPI003012AA7A